MNKKWYESKTFWFNFVSVCVVIATFIADDPSLLGNHMDADLVARWMAIIIIVGNVILRRMTGVPIEGTRTDVKINGKGNGKQ